MCSVNDDGISEMVKIGEAKIKEGDMCRKCLNKQAEVTLREKDFYCNSCFLTYFVHKFRSTIGKSKEIKPGDKVLITVSGDLSSAVLLHLIQLGLNEDNAKKLRFDPYILFINESILDSTFPSINIISEEVSKFKFPFYHTNFEEVMKNESSEICISTLEGEEGDHKLSEHSEAGCDVRGDFKDLFTQHLRSGTSRSDMILLLRNDLICRCAKQLGFRKVFLASTGTELSVRILSDIALGRGAQLADHVQFKATQFGVQLFRPLRELFDNEILHYATCHRISIPEGDGLCSNKEGTSIVSCTRDFISGLQRNFPSTVPTIFRTGSKLVNGSVSSGESTLTKVSENSSSLPPPSILAGPEGSQETCLLCGIGRDTSESAVCALEAIRVSKRLSSLGPHSQGGEGAPLLSPQSPVQGPKDALTEEQIYKYFCYGCGNLVQEVGVVNHLPPRVHQKLREKMREEQTLSLIQDCLI